MEEKQITVDGVTYTLDKPFFVIATQNPVETQGTFPLPEAQMDRFFMRLRLGYMDRDEELSVLRRADSKAILSDLKPVVTVDELLALQAAYPQVRVSDDVAGYLMDLIAYTRSSEIVNLGVSTRGALALYRAAQIHAALHDRDYVIPEDVKQEALCVLPHRIFLAGNSHLNAEAFLQRAMDELTVPLEDL